MSRIERRQVILTATGTGVTALMFFLAARSLQEETNKQTFGLSPSSIPAEAYEYPFPPTLRASPKNLKEKRVAELEAESYSCYTIREGDWLTKILREEGAPGIDPGPYALVHNNGEVQKFPNYWGLPNLVYPGEIFCFQTHEESFIGPHNKRGIVYQDFSHNPAIRSRLNQRSLEIQAAIRSKQGF